MYVARASCVVSGSAPFTTIRVTDATAPRRRRAKGWAKARQLNSPGEGTLSSYGYLLMVIHFLQSRKPAAVVPTLQVGSSKKRKEVGPFGTERGLAQCVAEGVAPVTTRT